MKVWHNELCEHCNFKTNKRFYRLSTRKLNSKIFLSPSVDYKTGVLSKEDSPPMVSVGSNISSDEQIQNVLEEHTDLFLIKSCENCRKISIYDPINNEIIHPFTHYNIPPNEDLTEDVKNLYNEASSVVNASPRAAMALLRLALDKIVDGFLNEEQRKKPLGKKVDIMFGNHNIPEQVKDIAHSIRGLGNESLHPGVIFNEVDREEVVFVFELINLIAEEAITKRRKMDQFISKYRDR